MGAVKKLRSIASELLKIETWPLHRIKPYERNARKIPKAAIEKVALSLREFGWQQPLVLEPDGTIIVGHVRRLGALLNGWTEAPVTIAHGLTAEQIKAYRLMDNRSHEEAGWDNKLLALDLSDLRGFDMSLTGFGDAELRRLLPSDQPEPEAQMDRAEELLGKWKVERGQIWEIGNHRLMCGDVLEDLGILCDIADVGLTDPPYNVGKHYGAWTDDDQPSEAYIEWSRSWFDATRKACWSCLAFTVGITNLPMWLRCIQPTHRIIAWIKENQCSRNYLGPTSGFNIWEPVLIYGKTVKCVPRDSFSEAIALQADTGNHPCPKAIKAWTWLVDSLSEPGQSILDPFLGSGTTMVAAQNLQRRCYGMEIEPKYCAVILERMSDMGLTPRLT